MVRAAAIVARIAWMFPAAYLPLLVSKRLRRKEGGLPPWRIVTLAGWCGARGVSCTWNQLAENSRDPSRAAAEAGGVDGETSRARRH